MSFALLLKDRPVLSVPGAGFAFIGEQGPVDLVTGARAIQSANITWPLSGRAGKGVGFNGTDTSLTYPTNPQYNILGPLTLVWQGIITNYTNYNMLVTRAVSSGSANNPFELRIESGSGVVTLTRANAGGYCQQSSVQSVSTGVVHTVVVTHPGVNLNTDQVSIYIDGIKATNGSLNASASASPATGNSEPLYLGRRADGHYFNGSTAFLAAFPRVFSADEIATASADPLSLGAP